MSVVKQHNAPTLRVQRSHLQGKAILVSPLLEHLTCPICTDVFTNPKVTQCGHTFCHNCIDEWIARKDSSSACPMCQTPLQRSSLFKHHTFDNLLDTVLHQQDATERAYFDALRQPSADATSSTTSTPTMTPIEQVFRRHLQRSLGTFQQYARTIEIHFGERERQYESRLAQLRGSLLGTTQDQVIQDIAALEQQLRECQQQQQLAMAQLVTKYDTHLSTSMPEPSLLPSTAPLFIAGHESHVQQKLFLNNINIHVEPTSFPSLFIDHLYLVYQQQNDPIVTKKSILQVHYIDAHSTKQHQGVIQLNNKATIYQQIGGGPIPPSSKFLIVGAFQATSDQPQNCFVHGWSEGSVQDYFKCKSVAGWRCGLMRTTKTRIDFLFCFLSCMFCVWCMVRNTFWYHSGTDCQRNWLCSSCASTCHAGHTVVPFLTQHKPSFACCYCKKTKCCQLKKQKIAVVESNEGGETKA